MIINCRPSFQSEFKVIWIHSVKGMGYDFSYDKEKVFKTYADANGFATSLLKRGVFVYPLESLEK